MRPIQIGCGPCAGISGGMDHCGMCIAYRRRISVLGDLVVVPLDLHSFDLLVSLVE